MSLFIYFFVFLYSVGGTIIFFAFYRRKVKTILEDSDCSAVSLGQIGFFSGFFNVLLGCAHLFLMDFSCLQLGVLLFLELFNIFLQICSLCKCRRKNRVSMIVLMLMEMNRVLFISFLMIQQLFYGS
jgi:hypothetical protein